MASFMCYRHTYSDSSGVFLENKFWHSWVKAPLVYLTTISILINSLSIQGYSYSNFEDEGNTDFVNEVQYVEIDTWSLLPQETTLHPRAGRFNPEEVVISLLDESSRYSEVENILGKPLAFSPTNPNISFNSQIFSKTQPIQIELKYQSKPFWHYKQDITAVTRYGNYIVFIEQQNIDLDNKKATLSFIDLSYFKPTLGTKNGYIPIFKIDIPITRNITSMGVENSFLRVNDLYIPRKILDEFSFLHSTTWNIQANLLSHESYYEQEPLIKSFVENLDETEEATSDLLFSRLDNLELNQNQIDSVQHRLKSAIVTAQNTIEKNKQITTDEDILNMSEDIARTFTIESAESQKRIKNSERMYINSRTLISKAKILLHRLTIPRPMAGGTIRQALGFVIGGLKGPNGEKGWQIKEGLLTILHKKKVTIGLPLASAILLGFYSPTIHQDFVYQIIDSMGSISEWVASRGTKFFSIFSNAAMANGTLQPQKLAVYFHENVIDRFFIANIDIIQKLFMIFAVPHITINAWFLQKDLRKDSNLRQHPIFEEYTKLKTQANHQYLQFSLQYQVLEEEI